MALTKIPAHLSSTPSISDSGSSTAITIDSSGNVSLAGNLAVSGSTTTADNLVSADKNITLNDHASNDTSSAANGAGITIQDAVNSSTDATILWNATDDRFDTSHPLMVNSPTDHSTVAILHAGGGTPNRGLKISTFSATNANAGVNLDAQQSTGVLSFSAAGDEKMRIANDGKVGIGYNSPANPLTVSGVITSGNTTGVGIGGTPSDANFGELGPGYLNLARDDTADAKQIIFGKNGVKHAYLETATAGMYIESIRDLQYRTTMTNSTAGHHIFKSYNTEIMRIDGANNRVGIGTDSPSGILTISDGGDSEINFVDGGTNAMVMKAGAGDELYIGSDNTYTFRCTNNARRDLLIDNGAFVGIGTASPGSALVVSGANNLAAQMRLINTNASPDNDWSIGAYYNDQTFRIRANDNAVNVMTMKDTGQVGINSTNPQTKFVVQHTDGASGIEFSMGSSLNYIQSYDRNASDYVGLKLDADEIRFGVDNGTEVVRIAKGTGTNVTTLKVGTNSDYLAGKMRVTTGSTSGGTAMNTGSFQEFRNVCTANGAGANNYWHIKTNFKCTNNIMFVARMHGYAYGNGGAIIDVQRSGYAYSGSGGSIINSTTVNNGTSSHTLECYKASDDYVVFRGYWVGGYYTGASFDIKMPSPTGYNWNFQVVSQALNTTSGNHF